MVGHYLQHRWKVGQGGLDLPPSWWSQARDLSSAGSDSSLRSPRDPPAGLKDPGGQPWAGRNAEPQGERVCSPPALSSATPWLGSGSSPSLLWPLVQDAWDFAWFL